jgi:hypothetical protein
VARNIPLLAFWMIEPCICKWHFFCSCCARLFICSDLIPTYNWMTLWSCLGTPSVYIGIFYFPIMSNNHIKRTGDEIKHHCSSRRIDFVLGIDQSLSWTCFDYPDSSSRSFCVGELFFLRIWHLFRMFWLSSSLFPLTLRLNFEKISKRVLTHPKVEGLQEWYDLKAYFNTFQMRTNVMGFQ